MAVIMSALRPCCPVFRVVKLEAHSDRLRYDPVSGAISKHRGRKVTFIDGGVAIVEFHSEEPTGAVAAAARAKLSARRPTPRSMVLPSMA
jgi:hypothetical protein